MAQERFMGQVEALVRQGAKDLYNALVPAFPQSVRGLDEPGTPLNPTQQMVTSEVSAEYEARLEGYRRQSTEDDRSATLER